MELKELQKLLEARVVTDVLNNLHIGCQRWNKGGALIHRVRAAGYMAEAGARNIAEGKTAIKTRSTFQEMHSLDRKMYDETIEFLLRIVNSGIYHP